MILYFQSPLKKCFVSFLDSSFKAEISQEYPEDHKINEDGVSSKICKG